MALTLSLLVQIKLIPLNYKSYHLLTVSDERMFILIVCDHSISTVIFIFIFFHFQQVKPTIERWFHINLGKVYTMKWVVIPLEFIFRPPWSIIKSNVFGYIFSLVINYLCSKLFIKCFQHSMLSSTFHVLKHGRGWSRIIHMINTHRTGISSLCCTETY